MKFSIVIPAYNAERTIQRCIDSVLNQTSLDYEIIVVNDGSTDKTAEILAEIKASNLYVLQQENMGVSTARNAGIGRANGEFVCFLDADDELLPNHLERLEHSMRAIPGKMFYATRFCTGLINGQTETPKSTGTVVFYANAVEEALKPRKMICTGVVCIRKDAFSQYGLFVTTAKVAEDVDMWERVYVHSGIVIDDTVTVKINRDASRATKKYVRMTKADRFDRLDGYLQDDSISADVKESLKKQYEWRKLHVVRSYLVLGNKKEAWKGMKEIDFSRIPTKRRLITDLCFIVPTKILMLGIAYQNRGKYQEIL